MGVRQYYNEDALLSRIVDGDEKAIRQFYDLHHLALIRFAFHLTNNEDQAEDAVTDAFISLWQRRTGFSSLPAMKAYLYRTVRNASLNWLEHQGVVSKNQPELAARQLQEEKDMEMMALQSEVIQLLYREIFRLPAQYSEVIKMLYLDDLSHEEAASRLGITEANLRMRKARAIEQLRLKLLSRGLFLIFLHFSVAKSAHACL